jgi:hypothetical protein
MINAKSADITIIILRNGIATPKSDPKKCCTQQLDEGSD